VAIAGAMAEKPPMLLCDEPTGSLDLDTGCQVLAAPASEGHHTVILVTHNSVIARMADRVLLMSSGRIVEDRRIDRPVACPGSARGWRSLQMRTRSGSRDAGSEPKRLAGPLPGREWSGALIGRAWLCGLRAGLRRTAGRRSQSIQCAAGKTSDAAMIR
jgi:energy-coupling factor transporter ATP-binding protein EcfA2